jgi:hypothetical protein
LASNPIIAAAGVITAIGFALQGVKPPADEARTSIDQLRDSFAQLDEESRKQKRAETAATINLLNAYIDLQEQIADVQETAEGGGAGFGAINANIRATKRFTATLTDNQKEILKQGDALLGVRRNTDLYTTQVGGATKMVVDLQYKLAALTRQQVVINEEVEEGSTAVRHYAGGLEEAAHAITDFSTGTLTARMSMHELLNMLTNVEVQTMTVTSAANNMGNAIADAFGRAAQEAMSFGQAMAMVAREVIVAYLAQTKAKILQNSAEGAAGTGPAYPIVMAALLSAGIGLMNSVQIPALAQGGVAYGPTMAMIGDNRNAAIDPEVVAPLSKLKDMMGGNQVEVFGRIQGNDIYLSNARTGTSRNRYA